MNKVEQFIKDPEWYFSEKMQDFFDWATSEEVEQSGIARWQLGYYDGFNACKPASTNSQYLEGYIKGTLAIATQIDE